MISKNAKYWYYSAKVKYIDGHSNNYDGIVYSDTGCFPLKKAELSVKRDMDDNFSSIDWNFVVEISKNDYEWKHSEMSKFVTVVGRMDEIIDRFGKGKGEIDG